MAKCTYYGGFKWAEPDVHLGKLLRNVHENPDQGGAKGSNAAGKVTEEWSV